jgi:hypothetical protein
MTVLGILPKVIVRDGIWALKLVAKSIATTDREIRKGKYEKYPSLEWAGMVSLLMVGYAAGMTVLGILPKVIVRDGIWALKLVAKSIATTDKEVRKGKYKNYPGGDWAVTVGLLMTGWAAGIAVLGILPKFIVRDGVWAVKEIAKSIVSTGRIFTKNIGVFKDGPKKEWAEGVSMAIGAFGEVYSLVLKSGAINAIFGGKIKPSDFGVAITTISSGIVEAARFFGNPELSGIWKPGPTKEWAEGIGLAISAFSPVYAMLLKNAPGFLSKGGGVGPAEFAKAVVTVSHGIIAAAGVFGENSAKFEEGKYPSAKWGKGVGAALKAFAPVFKALHEDVGMFSSGDEVINNMIKGIVSIAGAIVKVAKKFSGVSGSWTSYPDSKWGEGVKKAVIKYLYVVKQVEEMDVDRFTLNMFDGVVSRLVKTAKIMSKNQKYFNTKINPNFMKSISSNLFYYMAISDRLKSKQGGLGSMLKGALMGDPITNIANGMVKLSKAYDKLAISLQKVGTSMNSINDKKISQMERLSRITSGGGGPVGGRSSDTRTARSESVSSVSVATGGGPGGPGAVVRKERVKLGRYGDIATQNDKIIDLLKDLNEKIGEGSVIDTVMQKKLTEKGKSNLQ